MAVPRQRARAWARRAARSAARAPTMRLRPATRAARAGAESAGRELAAGQISQVDLAFVRAALDVLEHPRREEERGHAEAAGEEEPAARLAGVGLEADRVA